MFHAQRFYIKQYAKERNWYYYLPLWCLALYVFYLLLSYEAGGKQPWLLYLPAGFNFVIHELSHLVTGLLPFTLTVLAGSGSELVFGAGLLLGAIYKRAYFASIFGGLWFMLSTQSVADYVAGARLEELQLVALGPGKPIHDWHFLLEQWGLLEYDFVIAAVLRALGIAVAYSMLLLGVWLMWRMRLAKRNMGDDPLALAAALTSDSHDAAALATRSTTVINPETMPDKTVKMPERR